MDMLKLLKVFSAFCRRPNHRDGDMIAIAIVEDNEIFASRLQDKLKLETDWEDSVSITVFLNPRDLLKRLTEGERFDVCFSDVEMPGMNGIEMAERIREIDKGMLLVFLSSFPKYAIEGYWVYALDYILKECLDEKWDSMIERIREASKEIRQKSYYVRTKNRIERIPVKDIYYITKENKNAVFRLQDRSVEERKAMNAIADELAEYPQFILVKRGILVNIEKIQRSTAKELVMNNGDKITIGRGRIDAVREKIYQYVENSL